MSNVPKLIKNIHNMFDYARSGERKKLLQLICEENIPVNVADAFGRTALEYAVINRSISCATVLLLFGAVYKMKVIKNPVQNDGEEQEVEIYIDSVSLKRAPNQLAKLLQVYQAAFSYFPYEIKSGVDTWFSFVSKYLPQVSNDLKTNYAVEYIKHCCKLARSASMGERHTNKEPVYVGLTAWQQYCSKVKSMNLLPFPEQNSSYPAVIETYKSALYAYQAFMASNQQKALEAIVNGANIDITNACLAPLTVTERAHILGWKDVVEAVRSTEGIASLPVDMFDYCSNPAYCSSCIRIMASDGKEVVGYAPLLSLRLPGFCEKLGIPTSDSSLPDAVRVDEPSIVMESLLEYCYSGLIRSCTWDKLKEVNEIETLAQAARTYGRTDLANICQLYCELGNPVTVYLNESVASLRAHFYKDMNQFLQCRSSLWPDKTITITGTDFLTKVHGPVLARIEFFRVLFRSNMLETISNTISLEVEESLFQKLIYFLYTDELNLQHLNINDAPELINISSQFLIPKIKHDVASLLSDIEIDDSNVLEVAQFADAHQTQELEKLVVNYLKENLAKYLQKYPDKFDLLPKHYIDKVIASVDESTARLFKCTIRLHDANKK